MKNCKIVVIVASLFVFSVVLAEAQTLTVWHTENDPLTLAALDSIGKRFSQENSGVEVRFLSIGWDDLYRKLTLAIEGKEVPDLTQLEPFMSAYFYRNNLLLPLDDIVNQLNPDDIFAAVRDLQMFDGKRYGIATALGISYYAFRRDYLTDTAGFVPPDSWDDFKKFIQQPLKPGVSAAPLLLPANDLHITLLFTEFLAANGGSLFNESGEPDFMNPKVLQTLQFWKDLYDKVPPELRNSPYKENFSHFARGDAFVLPCFFGRGTLQIERTAPEQYRSPSSFAIFPHIIGPSGTQAYATLDAEPWVILKGSKQVDLAKRFLKFFYRKDNYLIFCQSVPIHLTPIFQSLAKGEEYRNTPLVRKWNNFYSYELEMLDKGAILPIFMSRATDRFLPALFKLEGTRVVSTMVRDVTEKGLPPEQAARDAMTKATELEPEPSSTSLTFIIIFLVVIVVVVVLSFWFRKKKPARV